MKEQKTMSEAANEKISEAKSSPISDEREHEIRTKLAVEEKERQVASWQRRKSALLEQGLSLRHLEFCYDHDGLVRREVTPASAAVGKIVGRDGLFILSGNVGCGKTQSAHQWLLQELHVHDAILGVGNVKYTTAARFARMSRYENGGEKFDQLARPNKLVIDDLGVEFADKAGSFIVDLDEMLDMRWSSKKATLILTNLNADRFKKRYGRRLYDRARGANRWFDVSYASMRGEG